MAEKIKDQQKMVNCQKVFSRLPHFLRLPFSHFLEYNLKKITVKEIMF